MKNVYGKNVFVTGASSGIGAACARLFAENGCRVLGVSRHCEEKTENVGNSGGSIEYRKMDVSDKESIHEAINYMAKEFGSVDIAILAAGMGVAGPAEDLPAEYAERQIGINYFGNLNVCREVLPLMRERRNGLVIFISSIAGKVPIPMQSHYSSSKYALEAYAECVRMEMNRFNVRACLLEPGDTKTGFTANRQNYDPTGTEYEEMFWPSVHKMEKDEQNGRPPESVAKVAVKMAGKRRPPARVAIGFEYKLLMFIYRLVPNMFAEWALSKMYLPK